MYVCISMSTFPFLLLKCQLSVLVSLTFVFKHKHLQIKKKKKIYLILVLYTCMSFIYLGVGFIEKFYKIHTNTNRRINMIAKKKKTIVCLFYMCNCMNLCDGFLSQSTISLWLWVYMWKYVLVCLWC